MSFIRALFGGSDPIPIETRSDPVDAFLAGEDPTTYSGGAVRVTPSTALSITSVYGAVSIIARSIASLPLQVFTSINGRKERAYDSPMYTLLHDQPNPEMTSYKWRELSLTHQLLWGAAVSEIEFRSGAPAALWPIPPWRVAPLSSPTTGRLVGYEVTMGDGKKRSIPKYAVLVTTMLGTEANKWASPITLHRETMALAKSQMRYGSKLYEQGTNPAGIITHPGKISEQAEASLRRSMDQYAGLSNAHRLMLLGEGMTWQRVGLPAGDVQYLDARKFSVSDIARIYNVPTPLLQDREKSTSWGTGLEEMNRQFVTYTLLPYLTQSEQELKSKLFADYYPDEAPRYNVEGFLRGKLKERYEAYAIGRNWGWLSANEIRALEEMNPIDNGDEYIVPSNMIQDEDLGGGGDDE